MSKSEEIQNNLNNLINDLSNDITKNKSSNSKKYDQFKTKVKEVQKETDMDLNAARGSQAYIQDFTKKFIEKNLVTAMDNNNFQLKVTVKKIKSRFDISDNDKLSRIENSYTFVLKKNNYTFKQIFDESCRIWNLRPDFQTLVHIPNSDNDIREGRFEPKIVSLDIILSDFFLPFSKHVKNNTLQYSLSNIDYIIQLYRIGDLNDNDITKVYILEDPNLTQENKVNVKQILSDQQIQQNQSLEKLRHVKRKGGVQEENFYDEMDSLSDRYLELKRYRNDYSYREMINTRQMIHDSKVLQESVPVISKEAKVINEFKSNQSANTQIRDSSDSIQLFSSNAMTIFLMALMMIIMFIALFISIWFQDKADQHYLKTILQNTFYNLNDRNQMEAPFMYIYNRQKQFQYLFNEQCNENYDLCVTQRDVQNFCKPSNNEITDERCLSFYELIKYSDKKQFYPSQNNHTDSNKYLNDRDAQEEVQLQNEANIYLKMNNKMQQNNYKGDIKTIQTDTSNGKIGSKVEVKKDYNNLFSSISEINSNQDLFYYLKQYFKEVLFRNQQDKISLTNGLYKKGMIDTNVQVISNLEIQQNIHAEENCEPSFNNNLYSKVINRYQNENRKCSTNYSKRLNQHNSNQINNNSNNKQFWNVCDTNGNKNNDQRFANNYFQCSKDGITDHKLFISDVKTNSCSGNNILNETCSDILDQRDVSPCISYNKFNSCQNHKVLIDLSQAQQQSNHKNSDGSQKTGSIDSNCIDTGVCPSQDNCNNSSTSLFQSNPEFTKMNINFAYDELRKSEISFRQSLNSSESHKYSKANTYQNKSETLVANLLGPEISNQCLNTHVQKMRMVTEILDNTNRQSPYQTGSLVSLKDVMAAFKTLIQIQPTQFNLFNDYSYANAFLDSTNELTFKWIQLEDPSNSAIPGDGTFDTSSKWIANENGSDYYINICPEEIQDDPYQLYLSKLTATASSLHSLNQRFSQSYSNTSIPPTCIVSTENKQSIEHQKCFSILLEKLFAQSPSLRCMHHLNILSSPQSVYDQLISELKVQEQEDKDYLISDLKDSQLSLNTYNRNMLHNELSGFKTSINTKDEIKQINQVNALFYSESSKEMISDLSLTFLIKYKGEDYQAWLQMTKSESSFVQTKIEVDKLFKQTNSLEFPVFSQFIDNIHNITSNNYQSLYKTQQNKENFLNSHLAENLIMFLQYSPQAVSVEIIGKLFIVLLSIVLLLIYVLNKLVLILKTYDRQVQFQKDTFNQILKYNKDEEKAFDIEINDLLNFKKGISNIGIKRDNQIYLDFVFDPKQQWKVCRKTNTQVQTFNNLIKFDLSEEITQLNWQYLINLISVILMIINNFTQVLVIYRFVEFKTNRFQSEQEQQTLRIKGQKLIEQTQNFEAINFLIISISICLHMLNQFQFAAEYRRLTTYFFQDNYQLLSMTFQALAFCSWIYYQLFGHLMEELESLSGAVVYLFKFVFDLSFSFKSLEWTCGIVNYYLYNFMFLQILFFALKSCQIMSLIISAGWFTNKMVEINEKNKNLS